MLSTEIISSSPPMTELKNQNTKTMAEYNITGRSL